ncbi:MAG: hypothetical protein N3D11_01970 [Candidatus Sumerlaeia bacterium]|nr:hypothetical protein [Candidatus Sumerlaeia bacterium]
MTGFSMIPYAAALVVAAASIASSPRTAGVGAGEESHIGKQLAVMARVLEKRLESELHDEIVTASMIQRGIEGYYVAGIGALFFVDAKFAVVAPETPKPPDKPQPDDLWARTEREIEGVAPRDPFAGSILSQSRIVPSHPVWPLFDPKKVERLKAVLFDSLAQYGKRLELVADSERVIVVVSGRDFPPAHVMTPWGGPEEKSRSVLIISVWKKDLGGDARELGQRALVEAYRY